MNTVMGLDLTPADIEALETRTEGWIVGLQLALHAGDDQAVAIAHAVGDGRQDDALGLARVLGAKDSHATGMSSPLRQK